MLCTLASRSKLSKLRHQRNVQQRVRSTGNTVDHQIFCFKVCVRVCICARVLYMLGI